MAVARRLTVALAVLALLAGCLRAPADPAGPGTAGPSPGQPQASPPAQALRFLAVGDMGTGDAAQLRVAQAMKAVCALRGCDLVAGLGDLIYPAGPSSPDDPQFDDKFEEPYAGLDLPFWMVLGNHDDSEDPEANGTGTDGAGAWHSAADHEVAYSQRANRTTDRWHLPARHYTSEQGPVHFIALDTNTMLADGASVPPGRAALAQEQEEWLPGAVAAGDAPWRIALGHHPYVSNGPHGDAGSYDARQAGDDDEGPAPGPDGARLKALFERDVCGKVDLYLAGHDHDLEWLEPVPSCGATHFIVSGGGGASLYDLGGTHEAAFQRDSLGFWWIEVTADTLHAVAYDQDAQPLFDRTVPKPIPQPPNGS
jgi:hypothetical protein